MSESCDVKIPSFVIYQSADKTVILLDIPRSLEYSQVLPGHLPQRRIYSDTPPSEPFPTPDPKRSPRHGAAAHNWQAQSPAAQISDLMTAASVESALQSLHDNYSGPFHLPRLSSPATPSNSETAAYLPVPETTNLHGSIDGQRQTFSDTAPAFKLIVLDPPWPNRSAKRRTDKYATVTNLAEMRDLLTSIPVSAHLDSSGLVAIWITNKATIPDFLTSPTGVFASWGVELAAEWTWFKITALGEPIFDVNSTWRKPWEKILIAKRVGTSTPTNLKSKVIIAAPDAHSRKPNLRGLFEDVFGESNYLGLEIFARNLTAGWWCWGDQVLKFQDQQYWAQE
ncbi:hypothetical protein QQS21_008033 [Conoideocrella luteorostrata]|uniref:MT-A70-domain-containing protein n=1 Tax=Conoideocrella luteorostrata TaxID=1105319 RepID=A0AAJ0FWD4_9HYPO|nr:hypothetical protein QQS21_008033 [Conoideocrella luteorostrata]